MSNVIRLQRRPRPLRKTYNPMSPYEVEREDQEDGTISFHVADVRPDSYRTVSSCNDWGNPYAKHDAEQIARGLNMLVQYGMETLPNVKVRGVDDFDDLDLEDDDE
ncbi:MAG TPA: hypothetical protein VK494_09430 [Gemmatimonadaceae bacterium]|nr:hypothetical protein [Gemmatimonadaceae bacterium]